MTSQDPTAQLVQVPTGTGESRWPMALAVLGGMAVSTLLTLFVVPSAYALIDDVTSWNEDRQRRGQGLGAGLGEAWSTLRHRGAHMRTRDASESS